MAGSYLDIPGTRMNLAIDGTVALVQNRAGGSAAVDATASLGNLSTLDPSTSVNISTTTGGPASLTFLFPELRTIKGLWWEADRNTGTPTSNSAEYSLDTVDGINGTWTAFSSSGLTAGVATTSPLPYYRIPALVNVSNVKAVRFNANGTSADNFSFRLAHVYGERSQAVDRLAFWHPTTDTELAGSAFDFGDVSRAAGATASKQFRIKNLSATKNATGLVVTASDLGGSPFGSSKLQVSTDNSTWVTATAGFSLSANTISSIMYCRLNPDTTLVTQVRAGRLTTTTSSYA